MNIDDIEKSKFTPMIQQYIDIKKDYRDTIVFFRIGDFYEMFFEDAYVASRILEIALTGKDAGVSERVPMCGIPFHAYQIYAMKLIQAGRKVAIVEQVEDPALTKGLVKRDVVKLITPGTITDGELNDKEANYIVSVGNIGKNFALCYAEVSTGEIAITLVNTIEILANEILSLHAKEIIISSNFNNKLLKSLEENYQIVISHCDNIEFPYYLETIREGIDSKFNDTISILLNYIIDTQKTELYHLQKIKFYESKSFLRLDPYTKRNLELTETLRLGQKNGSLLWLLDKCQTAMGSRMLHKWIDRPLIDTDIINRRLDYVEAFNNDYLTKEEIKNSLKTIYDLERIIGRVSIGNANAKDLVQLRRSLMNIPNIKLLVNKLKVNDVSSLSEKINPHTALYDLLEEALVDNPPLIIKEGGMIKEGFNSDLDEIHSISKNSKDWILNYEEEEKNRTGIKGLKVGYNRVFGYYIEITKSYLGMLGENSNYERKQTLANAERFVTPELKHYEQIVIGAKEKIEKIEYELFLELRNTCLKYINSLQELANIISEIDVLISLSDIAVKQNYVRPVFSSDRSINIVDGRHPVVETVLNEQYVANDIVINKYNTLLITGPNMSGKSTYMRELALIAIMAQIGSFVPAKSATLSIFDQIFTRIGASDDLISGQSTFMVEMMEANYAISNATKNSLILFDELGRGTSTYDGMALAQAIIEYVHEKIGCDLLFSTHYHELVLLENNLKRLKNVHVSAEETKDGIVFLHKVLDGGADKSYGINVASLAGLPKSLLERSKQILNCLEDSNVTKGVKLDLFNFEEYEAKPEVIVETKNDEIIKDLRSIDINNITPLEALNELMELKSKL